MRNQFAGTCYRCGQTVAPGDGHFERIPLSAGQGKWRMQHAICAIEHRGTRWAATPALGAAMDAVDAARDKMCKGRDLVKAQATGKAAQRARKRLRDAGLMEGTDHAE